MIVTSSLCIYKFKYRKECSNKSADVKQIIMEYLLYNKKELAIYFQHKSCSVYCHQHKKENFKAITVVT